MTACPGCHRPYDPREARPALEFTLADVRDELRARLRHEDRRLIPWCGRHLVDPAAAAEFVRGKAPPADDLLRALGLVARTRFVRRP